MTETEINAIREAYGLGDCAFTELPAHEGGRNRAYIVRCRAEKLILRCSPAEGRSLEAIAAELEFVHYLREGGAPVAGVIPARDGRLFIELDGRFVCLFEWAEGVCLADMGYRYRDGVPISEYYYNCGRTLGQIHNLSRVYEPVHRRYSFFDKYNEAYFDALLPEGYEALKARLCELTAELRALPREGWELSTSTSTRATTILITKTGK